MTKKYRDTEEKTVTHRAGWIVIDSENIIANGCLRTRAGKIESISTGKKTI